VRTVVTANTREPVVEDAAGEEIVGHLRDHAAPRAVRASEAVVVDCLQAMQMIRPQPKERRRLGASGPVDVTRHRGRVACHHSVARRAVSTQRRRGAGRTVLAADGRFRKRAARASYWSARCRSRR